MDKLGSQRSRVRAPAAGSRVRARPLAVVVAAALWAPLHTVVVAGGDGAHARPSEPSEYASTLAIGGSLRGGRRRPRRVLQVDAADETSLQGAASLFGDGVDGSVEAHAQGANQDADLNVHADDEGVYPEESIHQDDQDEDTTNAGGDHSDSHAEEDVEDDHTDASHHSVELTEGHSDNDGHDHSFLLAQTQSSASGYDVDSGTSPICWLSEGTTSPSLGLDLERYPYIWHTNFARDFFAGPTEMLEDCFDGFELEVEAPRSDEREEGDRLYTNKRYVYRIHGTVDVSGIREAMGNSFNIYGESGESSSTGRTVPTPRVSVELIFCRIRTMGGGLCSPFVYQHDIHGDAYVQGNDGEAHAEKHGESDGSGEEDSHNDHRRLQEGDHTGTVETEEEGHGHDESHDGEAGGHEEDHEFLTIDDAEVGIEEEGQKSHDEDESGHGAEDHAFLTSGVLMLDVDPDDAVVNIDVHVPFVMTDPESVFAIAIVRTLLSNAVGTESGEPASSDNANGTAFTYKFDASNIISERVIVYEDAPTVNTVTRGMLIFSLVLIGIVGATIAALLGLVIKHRKNKVFKLSQGSFLIFFLGSALVASASSFLLNPKNEVYCNLYGPLIMIPLQFMVAVVTGRLWRIQSLMQPLMGWANKNRKVLGKKDARKAARRWLPDFNASTNSQLSEVDSSSTSATMDGNSSPGDGVFRRCLHKVRSGRANQPSSIHLRRKGFRRKVSAKHMSLLVFLITLPQIFIQILFLSVSPFHHVIEWNDEMSVGRYTCYNSISAFNWLDYAIFFIGVMVLLVVAFRSRNLPSLFNEAGSMFSSVLATLAVGAIGIALIIVTNTPTSNPGVGYLLSVVIVLCFTLEMSVRIILPKLKLVWSGEAIVVSKLFQDHSSKKRGNSTTKDSDTPTLATNMSKNVATGALAGSFKVPNKNEEPHDSINHTSSTEKAGNGRKRNGQQAHLPTMSSITISPDYKNDQAGLPLEDPDEEDKGAQSRIVSSESTRKHDAILEVPHAKHVSFASTFSENTRESAIEIRENEPPPQEMIMHLLQVSQLVQRSSQRMLSGLQVSRGEWEELQDSFVKMGHKFEEGVKFDWQQGDQDELGKEHAH